VVIAMDVEARHRLQPRLEQFLAEQFPEAVSSVSPLELGPPVGWPVQYRVSGPDLAKVQDIALRLAQTIAAGGTVTKVNFDWMEPGRLVRIAIDQDQARLVGLDSRAIGTTLNSVVTGAPITQIRDDIYLVDVVGRAVGEQRVSLAQLQTLEIPLPNGRSVPLNQVATFGYAQEQPLVWRRDRVPTMTVRGDVVAGRSPEAVVTALTPQVAELRKSLPPGYQIAVGGTVEESARSQASVIAVVPVMLFLMVTFLMIQLQSFSRLFLVLSVVPMAVIGVVFTLLLFNRPLGFVAILGILALFGMVARNAVILIEQVEIERAQGTPPWDSVIAACMSRFRPIMLTAISTVLGMIPIAWTVFWGPMAFAIMGGLLVATVLTLIFLPALYVAFFRIREPTSRPQAAAA
jgi:multidrug efflux pump